MYPYQMYHHYNPINYPDAYYPYPAANNLPPLEQAYMPYPLPAEHYQDPVRPYNWQQMYMDSHNHQPEGQGVHPILQQFQNENGQIDINKMLSTVGQLANTVQQVSPVFKQVGDLIKSFR